MFEDFHFFLSPFMLVYVSSALILHFLSSILRLNVWRVTSYLLDDFTL